ncbi:hypothetical protein HFP72_11750 [Nocardiopsis sp. ARC36]
MATEAREDTVEAARAASTVTELMEVLWGRGRAVASAPVSPHSSRSSSSWRRRTA